MGSVLKVHRRRVRLEDGAYTLLSLRPTVAERFATESGAAGGGAAGGGAAGGAAASRIVVDGAGAQVLARLCWAMAFQDRPRTAVLIDEMFLTPNPWDGAASSPIVVVRREAGGPGETGETGEEGGPAEPFGSDTAAALRAQLPLTTESEGTVVLQTRGLDVALADPAAFAARDEQAAWRERDPSAGPVRHVRADGGLVVLEAPGAVLRAWAVSLAQGDPQEGPEYTGEVHVVESLSRPPAP
jgi:hypothetical protein